MLSRMTIDWMKNQLVSDGMCNSINRQHFKKINKELQKNGRVHLVSVALHKWFPFSIEQDK